MKNPFEALKTHLHKDAKNGSRSAILFAQIALFIATIFVWNTKLCAEHDRTGFKTALSYQIIAILVSNSRRLNDLRFIHKKCDTKVNSIANLICLILAIVLEKFYEKSLSSLGFAFSITVFFLILLVIIRPSTDLGLFGFLIGVIGSVAYNLFGLKFQTWIVVAICFPLLVFRFWLDKNWLEMDVGEDQPLLNRLEVGEDQSQLTDRSTGGRIQNLTVAGFHLFWVYILFRTNCQAMPKSISCPPSSVMGMLASLLIFNMWFGYAFISRVYSLVMMLIILLFAGVGCLHKRAKKLSPRRRKKNRKIA
ncbi:hypothetical protein SLEP1_g15869 [Rubroshorea leprosula]|uniref:Uncharacterized protein n=1 Tax=Rubroshorea leprosula TaxID=152421 RepID=A0AAV5IZK8_9ROSI|nr:hypothetical protein SLEP1_g15869 [Rubroshorea leprosula]